MPNPGVPWERMIARSPDGRTPGHEILPPKSSMVLERPGFERDWTKVPDLPDHVGKDGTAAWFTIWSECYWIWPIDAEWVLQVAECKDKKAQYRRIIESEGLMIDGGYSGRKSHPLLAEERRLDAQITKCYSKLGISPTDRASLALNEIQQKTGLAELQARQHKHTNGTAPDAK